jgi:hypothetical protein
MFKKLLKKISRSFLKKGVGYFFKEAKISSTMEQEKLTIEVMDLFYKTEYSSPSIVYSYPYVYFYKGNEIISKSEAKSGSQSLALYFDYKKMTYINKEEYVQKGAIVQIGAKNSSSGGSSDSTGSNNNNNNNNNNNKNG